MRVEKLQIENLRGLANVSFEFDQATNVIVGPNAIGKTTILEAIRLTKALLSPRYFQEGQQVLVSLGAMSPHPQLGNYVDFANLARDVKSPIKVEMELGINDEELAHLKKMTDQMATDLVGSRLGRSEEKNQLALTQFLSSKQGQETLLQTKTDIENRISELSSPCKIPIKLLIDPAKSSIQGHDQFNQLIISTLERNFPPHETLFSYFPADRAFPAGEANIQISSNEANAQIQSHLGQAATKYQRLKQTIVNNLLLSGVNQNELKEDFQAVLSNLLPGKELAGLSVTPVGTLKVAIKEVSTGKVFDIDGMSSGEKGLILTFMLLKRTLGRGGVALIDEPELHLNPAVCKNIISFLCNTIVSDNNLQIILCTHSAEILGTAFDRSDCTVHHLRTPNDATKIFERDSQEVFAALNRLGTTAADSLFSRGNIYVEGEHDSNVLEDSFFELLSGYKITSLGGRSGIEKEIKTLQDAEKSGGLDKLHCFIFDLDRKPSDLVDTKMVKILQWDRYCLENYLIGRKDLFDEMAACGIKDLGSRGEFDNILKELAMQQLNEDVAKEVYLQLAPESPGMRNKDVDGKNFKEVSQVLSERLAALKSELEAFDSAEWKKNYETTCETIFKNKKDEWTENWIKHASGKRLIDDLYKTYKFSIPKLNFKRNLAKRIMHNQTEDWTLIKSKIRDALQVSS